jgi:hypothetical protein
MNLRRFNELGTEQFRAFLGVLREKPMTPLPAELADDARFTEVVEPAIQIERPPLATKWDAGDYLFRSLAPIPRSTLGTDVGLWSWLAFWFFDQLCPPDGRGWRDPSDQNAPYIAIAGDHRYGLDKHFLFFPWKMRMVHGEAARPILSAALPKDSDEQRAWTAYYLNLSPEVIRLFTQLYWDPTEGKIKRGALSHAKKARGTLRRFIQLLKQLEVTYDIQGMTASRITALLPLREFEGWLPA